MYSVTFHSDLLYTGVATFQGFVLEGVFTIVRVYCITRVLRLCLECLLVVGLVVVLVTACCSSCSTEKLVCVCGMCAGELVSSLVRETVV